MKSQSQKKQVPGPVEYRDGRPVFVVEVDGLAASFVCPRCGATNRHGLGSEGQTFGHRLSHCPCWRPRGYYLQAPPPAWFLSAIRRPAPLLATP
jgi:hypothetical protein